MATKSHKPPSIEVLGFLGGSGLRHFQGLSIGGLGIKRVSGLELGGLRFMGSGLFLFPDQEENEGNMQGAIYTCGCIEGNGGLHRGLWVKNSNSDWASIIGTTF